MSDIWKIILLAGVGILLVGIYKEIRTLDREVMSRETIELEIHHLEWRLKKLEEDYGAARGK